MKLRYKLLTPFVFVLCCVIVVAHFYWLPQYKSFSESQSRLSTQKHLQLLAMALAPDLLSEDLAQVHNTLDHILDDRTEWRRILVTDDQGRRVYPVREIYLDSAEPINFFAQEIINEGKKVGLIQAEIDINSLIEQRMKKIWTLELLFVLFLVLASVVGILIQFLWIQRPLKKLAAGASRISDGHYDVPLPRAPKDEIGRLITSFANMKNKLQQREEQLTTDRIRVNAILDNAGEGIFTLDSQGIIQDINKAVESILGYDRDEIVGRNVQMLMPEDARPRHIELLKSIMENRSESPVKIGREVDALTKSGKTVPVWMSITELELPENALFVGAMTDLTTLKQAEIELRKHRDHLEELVDERTADLKRAKERSENLVAELEKALNEVKTLRGFLPICSKCKRIRDDKGYWQLIEQYIQDRSDAEFSHGICPDCLTQMDPDLARRVFERIKLNNGKESD